MGTIVWPVSTKNWWCILLPLLPYSPVSVEMNLVNIL